MGSKEDRIEFNVPGVVVLLALALFFPVETLLMCALAGLLWRAMGD